MYELTFLVNPNTSQEDLADILKQLKDKIIRSEGQIIKDFNVQQMNLAYPIKKLKQAYLVSIDFNVERDRIDSIKTQITDTKAVIRHLIITKQPAKFKPAKIKIPKRKVPVPGQPKTRVKMEELDKKLEEILEE